MSETAVVILNWNGLGYLKQFLGTVCKHTDNDSIIYVADNGSTDGSPEWVSENFSNVRIIRLDKNYGFAGGYNQALERLDAKYFVLLNSDIETTEGWLRPLIRHMESNPDVASCQPKILSYTKRDHFEYAGAAGGFIDKYGYPFCRGRIFNITEKDTGQYDTETDIFWSSGACMMVRAEAWKKCRGLDNDFFAHMEDVDLCWRFNNAGYRVTSIPESVVYHVGGGALPYNSPFKTYLNFRNCLFLLYKNLPDNKLQRIVFFRKILDGVAAIRFICKGDFGAVRSIWNAHIDYYKSLKMLKKKRKLVKSVSSSTFGSTNRILNKSIVFEFYVKGRKTFRSLNLGNLVK